jgi:SAM-dependent methyltransferase
MDINNLYWVLAHKDKLFGKILEVGSYIVSGQENIALRKGLNANGYEITGLDGRAGPGVDVVSDAKHMPFPDNHWDTIVSLDMLEHVDWPRDVVRECARVLRPGGHFFLATVFSFVIHSYPGDYWRFTPQALRLLIEDAGLEVVYIEESGDFTNPSIVRVIGRKPW